MEGGLRVNDAVRQGGYIPNAWLGHNALVDDCHPEVLRVQVSQLAVLGESGMAGTLIGGLEDNNAATFLFRDNVIFFDGADLEVVRFGDVLYVLACQFH